MKARIQSIIHDHRYVSNFSNCCLVANERCGLWYIDPRQLNHTAYFKSTDGHTGEWKFSMRRLNFHLLPLLCEFNGLVLVDSTRKGKLMPDALLKTLPIWCAVLNCIMFEDDDLMGNEDSTKGLFKDGDTCDASCDVSGTSGRSSDSDATSTEATSADTESNTLRLKRLRKLKENNWLVTPTEMVSRSEHASIMNTIPTHARELKLLGLISKNTLIQRLGRKAPILPLWVYPNLRSQSPGFCAEAFTICCLTTSYKMSPGSVVPNWNFSFPYVQGAGDDHELWASSDVWGGELSPSFFWDKIVPERREHLCVFGPNGDINPWLNEAEVVKRLGLIYQESQNNLNHQNLTPLDLSVLEDTGITIGAILSDIEYEQLMKISDFSLIICLSNSYKISNLPTGNTETLEGAVKAKGPETFQNAEITHNSKRYEQSEDSESVENAKNSKKVLNYQLESLKKGAKKLREVLPTIVKSIGRVDQTRPVVILCDTGSDLCVAVALCLLCLQFDRDWQPTTTYQRPTKDIVKQVLARISETRRVNPSRNTLQSVNAYIMG